MGRKFVCRMSEVESLKWIRRRILLLLICSSCGNLELMTMIDSTILGLNSHSSLRFVIWKLTIHIPPPWLALSHTFGPPKNWRTFCRRFYLLFLFVVQREWEWWERFRVSIGSISKGIDLQILLQSNTTPTAITNTAKKSKKNKKQKWHSDEFYFIIERQWMWHIVKWYDFAYTCCQCGRQFEGTSSQEFPISINGIAKPRRSKCGIACYNLCVCVAHTRHRSMDTFWGQILASLQFLVNAISFADAYNAILLYYVIVPLA